MKYPKKIYEEKGVIGYLKSRGLLMQYIRACEKLVNGNVGGGDFKERKPTKSGVWSFRINKQFRAIGYRRDDVFVVVEIDNHQ